MLLTMVMMMMMMRRRRRRKSRRRRRKWGVSLKAEEIEEYLPCTAYFYG